MNWFGLISSACAIGALVFSVLAFSRTRFAPREAAPVVYFIQRGEIGPVKIGTTRDLNGRLATLRTASSESLTVLGAIEGSRALEAGLHRAFELYRLQGEWFRPALPLLEHIFMICRTEQSCIALLQQKTITAIAPLSLSDQIEVLDGLVAHFEDLNRKAGAA